MLSRRSVRIKVMQLLYTLDRDSSLDSKTILKSYTDNIDKSYELFLFTVFVMYQITQRSTNDQEKRKSKHLPSDYDKLFTDKLFSNELIQDIVTNKALLKKFETLSFESKLNSDYIQKLYEEFSKKEEYKTFIGAETDNVATLEILLELFRFCRQHEYFNEILEDAYYNWFDDKSLVVGSVKKYLKLLPAENKTAFKDFLPEDETVKEFGYNLLKKTLAKKEETKEYLIPILENWDHERLAVVDTILIQMALTELMSFPSIPTNVTLNEYVELAKNYSTAKSKEFVNGILDKLTKELEEKGKIKKEIKAD